MPRLRQIRVLGFIITVLCVFETTGGAFQKQYKGIVINDSDNSKVLTTTKKTVGELLEEQNISVDRNDILNVSLDYELEDNAVIDIRRGIPISLSIDGIRTQVLTFDKTVGEFIDNYEEKNRVLFTPCDLRDEQPLFDNMEINLNTTYDYHRSVVENIPFEKEEVYTDKLFEGESRVVQNGIDGKLEKIYVDTYVSNSKINEQIVETIVLEMPAAEIIEIGTAPVPKTINGLVYSDELTMTATAYTAYYGCGAYTYTGERAQVGIVAVDPNVIPLGTKLFIQGYGQAVAGDTGGAIKGNKIDLYYNTYKEARNFGVRKIKVYVLE